VCTEEGIEYSLPTNITLPNILEVYIIYSVLLIISSWVTITTIVL
jgi:hypothetical protein